MVRGSRAAHIKSRQGCQTCKARHVKCDEIRPTCIQCRKRNRQCIWSDDTAFPRATLVPVLNNIVYQPALRRAFELTEPAVVALDFFRHITLPGICTLEPSSLWSYVASHIHTDESLCYVAAALGSFHLSATNATFDKKNGEILQLRALKSLRVASQYNDDADTLTILSCCLLLVMTQQLRQSELEFDAHLKHGCLIGLSTSTKNVEINECRRLLKQAVTTTVLFNSLYQDENLLSDPIGRKLLLSTTEDDVTLQARLSGLALEVFGAIELTSNLLQSHDLTGIPEAHQNKIFSLNQRYIGLQHDIDNIASLESVNIERTGLLQASCLLLGIFLRCYAARSHGPYSNEIENFEHIVSILDLVLPHDSVGPISGLVIAHGGICILFLTVLYCPQRDIRWKAIALMKRCPSRDGLWNSEQAMRICRIIIEIEEGMAMPGEVTNAGGLMPERCRVQYFKTIMQNGKISAIRLYRKPSPDVESLVYDDIPFI